ncbi:MAG: response regulator [bacterium]|nr:response regulator [bacterium]
MLNKTVLIVDDDKSINSILEFILQQGGYKTISTTSSLECSKIIKTNRHIDLVFLDMTMPDMPGLEVLENIHKIHPELTVIMMTGYSVDDQLKQIYEKGAYGVIYKPFDVEEVLMIIKNIFKQAVQE